MSLKKCKDCGATVSSGAVACPSCGKPQKRMSGCVSSLLVVIVVTVVVVGWGLYIATRNPSPPQPSGLLSPDQVSNALKPSDAETKKTSDPAWQKTKAGKIWKRHPAWSAEVCETLAAHKVRIGMVDAQVREAWGKPDHINKTSTANGDSEQWVWGSNQYAYFHDGFLTSIQQNGQ